MKIFKKIYKIIIRDGFRYTIIRIFARILGQNLEIQRVKDKVLNMLLEKHDYRVAYGPFKGMHLNYDTWWSKNDLITQTLGIYELHIISKIIELSNRGVNQLIDVGAADGYFCIGMTYANIYKKAYAFEIQEEGRNNIFKSAEKNKCSNRVHIFGEAAYADIQNAISAKGPSTVLIDIEGDEYEFLDNRMLNILKNEFIICELHPWLVQSGEMKEEELFLRASDLFKIDFITRDSYNPNSFEELSELSDEERLIAVGEGRDKNMRWLLLSPKHS